MELGLALGLLALPQHALQQVRLRAGARVGATAGARVGATAGARVGVEVRVGFLRLAAAARSRAELRSP